MYSGVQATRGRTCPIVTSVTVSLAVGVICLTPKKHSKRIIKCHTSLSVHGTSIPGKLLGTALHLALLRISLLDELKRVEQAVNCISMRGKKRLIGRRFPKSGSKMTVKIRTIRKRLGRALEMRNKLRLGRHFDEVSCFSFTNGGEGDLGGKRSGRLHSKLRP